MPQVTNNALLLDTLSLSRYLLAPAMRAFALHSIESRKWYFDPCDLIHVCLEYNTKRLFVTAFERLLAM